MLPFVCLATIPQPCLGLADPARLRRSACSHQAGKSRRKLFKRFEDFLARNRAADRKQRVLPLPANDSNLVPWFWLRSFHSNQHQATVAFWQNVDDVACANARLFSSLGRYHHLSATVNCCMHE